MSALTDTTGVTGLLKIDIVRGDGSKQTLSYKNRFVDAGANWLASRAVETSSGAITHMAVGTSSTAPAAANTALGTQLARVTCTTARTDNVITYVAVYPPGTATGAVAEAGLFNAATGGTMPCRSTFGVITKAVDDQFTITWQLTVNATT